MGGKKSLAKGFWNRVRHALVAAWVVLGSVAPAFAGPVETLLASPHRPTVTDLKAAFGGRLPEKNPFGEPTDGLQGLVQAGAPAVIAAFEKAYPGATFASLGRDSVFLGDILDAFYLSLGQNRVRRLSASGASLTGRDEDLIDFLKTSGFDLDTYRDSPPFVFFDQTNWNSTSQSRTYLNAVYRACRARDCDPVELVDAFNFLNTGSLRNMYRGNAIQPNFDIAKFLDQRRSRLRSSSTALLDDVMSVHVNSSLVYTLVYHDTFSKFERDPSGRVFTRPGALGDENTRRRILSDLFETVKSVESRSFLARTWMEAAQLGYRFPLRRIRTASERTAIRGSIGSAHTHQRVLEYLRSVTDRKLAAEILVQLLPKLPERGRESLQDLAALVSETPTLRDILLAVLEAQRESRINTAQVRAVLAKILMDIEQNRLSPAVVSEAIRAEPALSVLFRDESPRFYLKGETAEGAISRAGLVKLAASYPDVIDLPALEIRLVERFFESIAKMPKNGPRPAIELSQWLKSLASHDAAIGVQSTAALQLKTLSLMHSPEFETLFRADETANIWAQVLSSIRFDLDENFELLRAHLRLSPKMRERIEAYLDWMSPQRGSESASIVSIARVLHEVTIGEDQPGPLRKDIDRLRPGAYGPTDNLTTINGKLLLHKARALYTDRADAGAVVIDHLESSLLALETRLISARDYHEQLELALAHWPEKDSDTERWLQNRYRESRVFRDQWRATGSVLKRAPSSSVGLTNFRRLDETLPTRCALALKRVTGRVFGRSSPGPTAAE